MCYGCVVKIKTLHRALDRARDILGGPLSSPLPPILGTANPTQLHLTRYTYYSRTAQSLHGSHTTTSELTVGVYRYYAL